MTVSFGHAAHLASVWLPELTPTTRQVVSTVIAMLAMALILTGVAALFAVFCLEKTFTWLRAIATFVVSGLLIVACAGGLQQITGTQRVKDAMPADSQANALKNARTAAAPASSWTEHAREVSADGRTVQTGWTKADLARISETVAASQHMRVGYASAPAVLDTTKRRSDADIAQHGTPFFKGSEKVRCAITLKNLVKNNVGQPVTAVIDSVRCVPAASWPVS